MAPEIAYRVKPLVNVSPLAVTPPGSSSLELR